MKKPLIAIGLSTLLGCSAGGKASSGSTSNSDAPGSLESYAPATTYAVANLKDSLESKICPNMQPQDETCKNINEPHLKDDYGFTLAQLDEITNNVQSYTITYNTPGVHAENRSVSGGILIPHLTNKQEFKGIVLYFHPTEVSKYFVPSCFKDNPNPRSYCMGKSSYYGEELGAVLASQGYIVVMPDYIGQGLDNKVAHPYVLYPEVNALSGINMLTATRTLLTDKLGYTNIPNNLYIAGFSEGGAYALWTTKMLQTTSRDVLLNNKLTLKRTAAMSGAYDLDKAQLPMELANTKTEDDNPFYISNDLNAATAKPILIAYLLSAYGFYDLDQNYTSLLRPEFFNCVTCLISGKSYTIADLFNDPNLSDLDIKTYLASAAALTGYWVNGDTSAKALVKDSLLDDPAFNSKLAASNIYNWNTNIPISLIYLSRDSVVTNINSTNAYNGIKSSSANNMVKAVIIDNSPTNAQYYYQHNYYVEGNKTETKIEPIDHSQAEAFSLIAALTEFNQTP